MTVDACKHDDGSKSVTVEFDAKEVNERLFASMLIDRFLELPLMAFGGEVETHEEVIDRIAESIKSQTVVSNE